MRRLTADYTAPISATTPGTRVESWLKDLRLLRGIPLGHLVPDTCMLPEESLRFFTLDRGWLDALCDGALSLRSTGRADAALRSAAIYRASGDDPAAPVTGFLLRSVAVWRWPSIAVCAYGDDEQELEELRCDRPAPDVLLALYAGTVRAITLAEPAQTLHYGFESEAGIRATQLARGRRQGARRAARLTRRSSPPSSCGPASASGFPSGDAAMSCPAGRADPGRGAADRHAGQRPRHRSLRRLRRRRRPLRAVCRCPGGQSALQRWPPARARRPRPLAPAARAAARPGDRRAGRPRRRHRTAGWSSASRRRRTRGLGGGEQLPARRAALQRDHLPGRRRGGRATVLVPRPRLRARGLAGRKTARISKA